MKNVIIILLLFTQVTYAQLSEDSLKKICVNDYARILDRQHAKSQNEIRFGAHTDTVRELFSGYFKDIRVMLLQCNAKSLIDWKGNEIEVSDVPMSYSKLYFLDARTGQPIDAKRYKSFNEIVNTANKKITNLDKCYLYLFFYNIEPERYGLTSLHMYKNGLNDKSIFLAEEEFVFNHFSPVGGPTPPTGYYDDEFDAVAESNNNQVYIFVNKSVGLRDTAYFYQFDFNKKGLKDVRALQIKEWRKGLR
ncbi:MAG: hypothetical protein P4L41_06315 [Flavipsychrobacter sp.]|nr:hypothetical protein [Flavipsychrobacter sp.]